MRDLGDGDVGFPMDGRSLTRLLHQRGINVRYLGLIYAHAAKADTRLHALKQLTEREMISRAFKHVANAHLRELPALLAPPCLAHLLNCLLGGAYNANPIASIDENISRCYPDVKRSYSTLTPPSLQAEVARQVFLRFRHDLAPGWVSEMKHLQLLREIALKLGLQLIAKDYHFSAPALPNGRVNGSPPVDPGATPTVNGHASSHGKKKHRAGHGAASQATSDGLRAGQTFIPEDILNIVPLVKEASPRVSLEGEGLSSVDACWLTVTSEYPRRGNVRGRSNLLCSRSKGDRTRTPTRVPIPSRTDLRDPPSGGEPILQSAVDVLLSAGREGSGGGDCSQGCHRVRTDPRPGLGRDPTGVSQPRSVRACGGKHQICARLHAPCPRPLEGHLRK